MMYLHECNLLMCIRMHMVYVIILCERVILGMLGPASSSGRTDDDQPTGQVKDGDKVTSS